MNLRTKLQKLLRMKLDWEESLIFPRLLKELDSGVPESAFSPAARDHISARYDWYFRGDGTPRKLATTRRPTQPTSLGGVGLTLLEVVKALLSVESLDVEEAQRLRNVLKDLEEGCTEDSHHPQVVAHIRTRYEWFFRKDGSRRESK